MSAVVISVVASPPPALPRCGSPACPPVGMLADGTPFYAPIGEVAVDGPLVTCHLCGRALRSVTAHLRVHGWTKQAYCEAFGLERGQSLEGQETRKLRAAAFTSRLVLARAASGASLAAISREAGLHKDWLSRHLGDIDPGAAAAVLQGRSARCDARWLPALNRLGYTDVASYLAERHLVQHRTVNAIAAEAGMSHHAVGLALRRHG